nr:MAG TPA: hypothetical protein [Caudoviricetes sp.]
MSNHHYSLYHVALTLYHQIEHTYTIDYRPRVSLSIMVR